MNKTLQTFARQELKDGLQKCTESQQMLFKRMYSYLDLTADLNTVVDNMREDQLSHAMSQVERTLAKQTVANPNG
jgi:RNA-binding protein YlmH